MADAAAGAAGPAVGADGPGSAAGSYESAVKAAGMDAVHTELAFSVWEPQTAIPPKRVSSRQQAASLVPNCRPSSWLLGASCVDSWVDSCIARL